MLSHWRVNIASWWGLPTANWFFLGEFGVDLFFALSGFLIGRILLDLCSCEPTWRDLAVFMIRRWMRTIPLYALMLIFLGVFYPRQGASSVSMIEFGTFTQNVWTSMPPDNWFATSWTLSIEEWFYVLFGIGALGTVILTRSMRLASVPLVLFLVLPLLLRCLASTIDLLNAGLLKMVPFRLEWHRLWRAAGLVATQGKPGVRSPGYGHDGGPLLARCDCSWLVARVSAAIWPLRDHVAGDDGRWLCLADPGGAAAWAHARAIRVGLDNDQSTILWPLSVSLDTAGSCHTNGVGGSPPLDACRDSPGRHPAVYRCRSSISAGRKAAHAPTAEPVTGSSVSPDEVFESRR